MSKLDCHQILLSKRPTLNQRSQVFSLRQVPAPGAFVERSLVLCGPMLDLTRGGGYHEPEVLLEGDARIAANLGAG